jgi:hypothetical protein
MYSLFVLADFLDNGGYTTAHSQIDAHTFLITKVRFSYRFTTVDLIIFQFSFVDFKMYRCLALQNFRSLLVSGTEIDQVPTSAANRDR